MKRSLLFVSVTLLWIAANAQTGGCTDPRALNYDAAATYNDGSCVYSDTSLLPIFTDTLSTVLSGTSGIVLYRNLIWTMNDHYDNTLYLLDTNNGSIVQQIVLNNVVNQDIEEMDQDSAYLYLGDFGNNYSGNRTDLHILRVEKQSLFFADPVVDTISFSYSDQTDFSEQELNTTDFDCEAFVVVEDSIYLFTKQWNHLRTALYVLPKTPGTYVAQWRDCLTVNGLVTGACYQPDRKQVVLCGYSALLSPFLFLLYDYPQHDFFSGNKRKVSLDLPFHQIEAVAAGPDYRYYLTNEAFAYESYIHIPAKFHIVDLADMLSPTNLSNIISPTNRDNKMMIYPNPARHALFLKNGEEGQPYRYEIWNILGQCVASGFAVCDVIELPSQKMQSGYYVLKLYYQTGSTTLPFVFQ